MELLLSGALVFSLLQLPGLLDRGVLALLPLVAESFRALIVMVSVYLRAAMVALAAAFVVHLMLRAWWVALVGVNSVFPQGPRWDRMRQGPLAMERLRRLWRPFPQRIEQIDNAASVVFGTGVGLGLLMLSLALCVGVLVLCSSLLGHWQVLGWGDQTWLWVLMAVLILPQTIGGLVDLALRRHPPQPGSRTHRVLKLLIDMQALFPGVASASALLNTLLSNLVRRGAVAVGVVIMCVAILVSVIASPLALSRLRPAVLAPEQAGALSAQREHYRDQRRGLDRLLAVPSIASQELGDEALRLFVPLQRHAHPAVVRGHCPDVYASLREPAPDQAARLAHTQALLKCLHDWTRPELDGQALPDYQLIFSEDPHSGLEGLLWRVPGAAIAEGRHVLNLRTRDPEEETPTGDQQRVSDEAEKRLAIVFFK